MADVSEMLDRSIGVAVALKHYRFTVVLVEEDFVLKRAAVPGPDHLHGLGRQALPFLHLAGVKLDTGDALDLFRAALLPEKTRSITFSDGLGFNA